jgi:hypothetical protein
MDAHYYTSQIVDPTIADFESQPKSVRHAFLACVVTFHWIDYLTQPNASANLRRQFREESPGFALIDRVAHAFKHVESGHPQSPNNSPLMVDDITERPLAAWREAIWGKSRWGDSMGGVEIANEAHNDLLNIVKRAAEFLHSKQA